MSTWIVGGLIVAIIAAICFLVYEFANAPLCDDDNC